MWDGNRTILRRYTGMSNDTHCWIKLGKVFRCARCMATAQVKNNGACHRKPVLKDNNKGG